MSNCLTKVILLAYVHRMLEEWDDVLAEAHINQCTICDEARAKYQELLMSASVENDYPDMPGDLTAGQRERQIDHEIAAQEDPFITSITDDEVDDE